MTIVVLGSINADAVLNAPRLPVAGETIRATSLQRHPGGKGANQAVAAARMGAAVELIGRVGDDADGMWLRANLRTEGVGVSNVGADSSAPTGTALITVAADGANTIVTVGGANHRVGDDELRALQGVIGHASVLVVQLEIPMDVVERAAALAADAGVVVMCDPAPVAPLSDELCRRLSWITPNSHEAAGLTGTDDAAKAAAILEGRGVEHVVITLGERGAWYRGEVIAAPLVRAVDTVACGDAFTGCLAVSLASGLGVAGSLRRACAAGALAATRAGAASSLPTGAEVDELLA